MTLVAVTPLPGINTSSSPYAAGKLPPQGRYVDGDKIRFVAGFPEKIGGWAAVAGLTEVVDVPRVQRSWRAGTGDNRIACGTGTHLYQYAPGDDWENITPLRVLETGTLGATPLATTNGAATVVVTDAAQTLHDGDWVYLSASASVGGLDILGWYQVSARSGAGYTITASTDASSTTTGGGTVTYEYPRTTLTNPFATQSGLATVTVTDVAHGASTGNYVSFSGASAVGGLTISGEYQLTKIDADSYTITAASTASSTTSGGGSVSTIYLIDVGTVTTPTPVAYGVGAYGVGPYGYAQLSEAATIAGWTLAAYGTQMLANPIGGTIYVYDPASGGRAYPLLNAPDNVQAMFVTPERFVVALGTAKSPMTMAWADQDDYTVWTATPTNTANQGRTKQGGSTFVGGISCRDGESLAWSDKALFQLSYSGDNLVYDTPGVADNAGLVSPWAAVSIGGVAYWMGDADFWMWDGTVRQLPSEDIWNDVFQNINKLYLSKCWAWLNRQFNEVWFNYCSASATEIDRYAVFHLDQQVWSIGSWADLLGSGVRTCGEDSRLFSYPMMMDIDGVLYQHELGYDDNGQPLAYYIEKSPVDISDGNANVDVFGFIPDYQRVSASSLLSILTKQYPQDTATTSGPFTITATGSTPVIDLRSDGKMVGWRIESAEIGSDFRFGVPRVDIQPGGARR